MPVSVHFPPKPDDVVYFTFEDPWTWEEFGKANAEAGAVDAQADHIVDAVFDLSRSQHLPFRAMSVLRQAAAESQAAPNEGVTIIYGATSFVGDFIRILTRIDPATRAVARFATTETQIQNILAEERARRAGNAPTD